MEPKCPSLLGHRLLTPVRIGRKWAPPGRLVTSDEWRAPGKDSKWRQLAQLGLPPSEPPRRAVCEVCEVSAVPAVSATPFAFAMPAVRALVALFCGGGRLELGRYVRPEPSSAHAIGLFAGLTT